MVKVKTMVSGCLYTETSAEDFLKIMSYVGTDRKQSVKSFLAIMLALNGESKVCWV